MASVDFFFHQNTPRARPLFSVFLFMMIFSGGGRTRHATANFLKQRLSAGKNVFRYVQSYCGIGEKWGRRKFFCVWLRAYVLSIQASHLEVSAPAKKYHLTANKKKSGWNVSIIQLYFFSASAKRVLNFERKARKMLRAFLCVRYGRGTGIPLQLQLPQGDSLGRRYESTGKDTETQSATDILTQTDRPHYGYRTLKEYRGIS